MGACGDWWGGCLERAGQWGWRWGLWEKQERAFQAGAQWVASLWERGERQPSGSEIKTSVRKRGRTLHYGAGQMLHQAECCSKSFFNVPSWNSVSSQLENNSIVVHHQTLFVNSSFYTHTHTHTYARARTHSWGLLWPDSLPFILSPPLLWATLWYNSSMLVTFNSFFSPNSSIS